MYITKTTTLPLPDRDCPRFKTARAQNGHCERAKHADPAPRRTIFAGSSMKLAEWTAIHLQPDAMRRRLVASGSLMAAAMFVAPTTVQAQIAATAESGGEILVTARKRSENVQNVPIAITAFNGAQLKDQSVKTIVDLQGQVPGLYLQTGADDPQSLTILLRGRKQNDSTLAVDPSVGIYIDGIYIPRTFGLAGALVDINRVEVLRGPQGTLYGRNTTGGALRLFTNDPTKDLLGSATLTIGNYGTMEASGILNIPLNDKLRCGSLPSAVMPTAMVEMPSATSCFQRIVNITAQRSGPILAMVGKQSCRGTMILIYLAAISGNW